MLRLPTEAEDTTILRPTGPQRLVEVAPRLCGGRAWRQSPPRFPLGMASFGLKEKVHFWSWHVAILLKYS